MPPGPCPECGLDKRTGGRDTGRVTGRSALRRLRWAIVPVAVIGVVYGGLFAAGVGRWSRAYDAFEWWSIGLYGLAERWELDWLRGRSELFERADVFDVVTGRHERTYRNFGVTENMFCFGVVPPGRFFVMSESQSRLGLFDSITQRRVSGFDAADWLPNEDVTHVDVLRGPELEDVVYVEVGRPHESTRFFRWDTSSGEIAPGDRPKPWGPLGFREEFDAADRHVAWSREGPDAEPLVRIWDRGTEHAAPLRPAPDPSDQFAGLTVSHDGRYLALLYESWFRAPAPDDASQHDRLGWRIPVFSLPAAGR